MKAFLIVLGAALIPIYSEAAPLTKEQKQKVKDAYITQFRVFDTAEDFIRGFEPSGDSDKQSIYQAMVDSSCKPHRYESGSDKGTRTILNADGQACAVRTSWTAIHSGVLKEIEASFAIDSEKYNGPVRILTAERNEKGKATEKDVEGGIKGEWLETALLHESASGVAAANSQLRI